MPSLEDLAEERDTIIQNAMERARLATNDDAKTTILIRAIEQVRDQLSNVTVGNMSDKVSVSNLDEVKLHLRKELTLALKPLLTQFASLNMTKAQVDKIKDQADLSVMKAFDDNFDTMIIKKPRQRFSVDNLTDIQFPSDFSINNLGELQQFFNDLSETIRSTFNINIPTPEVNVEAPSINIPESVVNVDAPDFTPLLDALKPLKFVTNNPKKPISVRMSDGEKFIAFMKDVINNQQRQMTAFSNGGINKGELRSSLRSNNTGTIATFTKTITTAGTALPLVTASTPCFGVRVHADVGNTGDQIAVGDSAVVAASGTQRGVILSAADPGIFLPVNNLNLLYGDVQSDGDKICGSYFSY